MIDNYDSFTYNLVQYFGELGKKVKVFRNDKVTLKDIEKLGPEQIVISPGPGRPDDAGISKDLIQTFKGRYPILGVCLGHQCIGEVFGGKIVRARRIMHGKTSRIIHNGKNIFNGLPDLFEATRYHSLIIEMESVPDCLEVTARTERDEIMGVAHKEYLIYGIQFHPESILTRDGKDMLKNFLYISERFWEKK